ncbi:nucleic acid-binding protein [Calocera cornea HHB12733]|uniref:Nucleic acid-binding protein n=1 Tax=Calocera cornea HHB12733 TaxID=1353952 RepID=A0A165G4C7_9BASI|nr:nucleic acid-binding protein [Calocera cornea HHB12733]
MTRLPPSIGAVETMILGQVNDFSCQVQVLKITPAKRHLDCEPDRYFVELSDSDRFFTAILDTSLNHLVTSDEVKTNSVVRIEDFIIILKMRVLHQEDDIVGDPSVFSTRVLVHALCDDHSNRKGRIGDVYFERLDYGDPPPENIPIFYRRIQKATGKHASDLNSRYIEIADINSESLANFYVIARLSKRSEKTPYFTDSGSGIRQLFVIHDASGDMGIVAWNAAVEKADDMEVGKVYAFYNAGVLRAKDKYNSTTHPYQLTFNANAQFQPVDDDHTIPCLWGSFVDVAHVTLMGEGDMCDIRGIIVSVGEPIKFKPKNADDDDAGQDEKTEQACAFIEFFVADYSGAIGRIVAFEPYLHQVVGQAGRAVSIRRLKWDYRHGPSLMTKSKATNIVFDDEDPDHIALLDWWEENKNARFRLLSGQSTAASNQPTNTTAPVSEMTIADALKDGLVKLDTPHPIIIVGEIEIQSPKELCYQACCDPKCNKRARKIQDRVWSCASCNTTFPKPRLVYNIPITVNDGTGVLKCTAFDAVGRQLFGDNTATLQRLLRSDSLADGEELNQYLQHVAGKYRITVEGSTSSFHLSSGETVSRENWVITRLIPDGAAV